LNLVLLFDIVYCLRSCLDFFERERFGFFPFILIIVGFSRSILCFSILLAK